MARRTGLLSARATSSAPSTRRSTRSPQPRTARRPLPAWASNSADGPGATVSGTGQPLASPRPSTRRPAASASAAFGDGHVEPAPKSRGERTARAGPTAASAQSHDSRRFQTVVYRSARPRRSRRRVTPRHSGGPCPSSATGGWTSQTRKYDRWPRAGTQAAGGRSTRQPEKSAVGARKADGARDMTFATRCTRVSDGVRPTWPTGFGCSGSRSDPGQYPVLVCTRARSV
jgi:hypothetical protein